MKLQNFHLETESHAIAFIGLERYWDLHAYAALETIQYSPGEDKVELAWSAPSVTNPWGDHKNVAAGLRLRFNTIRLISVTGGEAYPRHEDQRVSSVSQVDTREPLRGDPIEFRMRREWQPEEDFGVLFIMQSGRTVEIQAESAELIEVFSKGTNPYK